MTKNKNTYLQDLVYVLHLKTVQVNYIIDKECILDIYDIILHFNGCYFDFCNSEVMTSLPHSLTLDSQLRFGAAQSEFSNLNYFLIK